MRNTFAFFLTVFSAATVWGQASDAVISFEVASVKASLPADGRGIRVGCNGGPGTSDPSRITCTNMSRSNLVASAYGIAYYQLAGLSLADADRFDIAAKIPEGTTKDQVKLMWQNLLAQRFKLAVHSSSKEMSTFELVVAKSGLKIKEAVEEDAAATSPALPDGSQRIQMDQEGFPKLPAGRGYYMAMMNGKASWRMSGATMAQFAQMLGGQVSVPVTDATGLKGKYDFVIYWADEPLRNTTQSSSPDSAGPTLFAALQGQLGLKLESKKAAVEILVVDHIDKVPTEN